MENDLVRKWGVRTVGVATKVDSSGLYEEAVTRRKVGLENMK